MSALTNRFIKKGFIIQKGIRYHDMANMHSLLLCFFRLRIQMLAAAHCFATYFLLVCRCFLRFMKLDSIAITISHLRFMIGKADCQLYWVILD